MPFEHKMELSAQIIYNLMSICPAQERKKHLLMPLTSTSSERIESILYLPLNSVKCNAQKVCRKFGTFQMALTILHKMISETVSSVSHQCEQAFPVSISLCTKIVSKFVERLNSSAFDFEKKMKR